MTVIIDGNSLTIDDVIGVARRGERVEVSEKAVKKVLENAELVRKVVEQGQTIYGVTTGIGDLVNVRIDRKDAEELQRRIVRSHQAGTGRILAEDFTRATMLLRANAIAKGYSGVRPITLSTLVEMLNRNVLPVIYEKGSLGASGDLAPLAHIAAVVMGEGEAFYRGRKMPGADALAKAGLKPVNLTYKEAIGLINGTQMMTAVGVLVYHDTVQVFKTAQIATALTMDALASPVSVLDARVHKLRPYKGQQTVASNLRALTRGRMIGTHATSKIQDGYSLRCAPQILGATYDALEYIKKQLETEINSAVDNPLFFTETGDYASAGNFHGQPISMALDFLAIALANVGNLGERHINRLLDAKLSNLPEFLAGGRKGINSGLMVAQYTAGALVCENRILANPAGADTISVSADQEDHTSLGPIAAFKARDICENTQTVIAIELLCAAQALDWAIKLNRISKAGAGAGAAYDAVRKSVPFMDDDRPLQPDFDRIRELIRSGDLLAEVEKTSGKLK